MVMHVLWFVVDMYAVLVICPVVENVGRANVLNFAYALRYGFYLSLVCVLVISAVYHVCLHAYWFYRLILSSDTKSSIIHYLNHLFCGN